MALVEETKKPWYLSKTLWMQVLAIVAIIIPASAEFIKQYFAEAGIGWALINMILRLVSKDQIEISASTNKLKAIFIPLLLIGAVTACGWFGGGDDEQSGGGYPDPARVCKQVTEENKEALTLEMGRSCKVGDWISKGAPSCSSSLEKCMKKVY